MFGNPAHIEADIERNAAFDRVDTWIFDLDNTLYPARSSLFGQIDDRIRAFVARELGVSLEAAHKLQKDLYRRYGTSLRGLMTEHGFEPKPFLDYVHDIDHSVLDADPRLAKAIGALPGRHFIMTNGTRAHAEKTAAQLGIGEQFDGIFDIVAADLVPKPSPEAYGTFFALHGIEPTHSAMFEDLSRNLAVPHAAGIRTVLVTPQGGPATFRDASDETGDKAPHVDFVTDDLAGFLETLVAGRMTTPRNRR
ncbi:MAG: pyrimidine 5'-nucleotidase [Ancalomicrobiaceae bacterium]|nr:pyrimidine 5'-nucleotidase [Ancalomicrobiaceae bacterium]